MIVDSSALLAIIFSEPEGAASERIILEATDVAMSTASYLEIGLKLDRRLGSVDPDLDAIVAALDIQLLSFTAEHGRLARAASVAFCGPPANLNFGDCMTYALAKATRRPLLFKGKDFLHTDLDVIRLDQSRT